MTDTLQIDGLGQERLNVFLALIHRDGIFKCIFKCISLKEKFYILIQITLKFVHEGSFVHKSACFQLWLVSNRRQVITSTNDDQGIYLQL